MVQQKALGGGVHRQWQLSSCGGEGWSVWSKTHLKLCRAKRARVVQKCIPRTEASMEKQVAEWWETVVCMGCWVCTSFRQSLQDTRANECSLLWHRSQTTEIMEWCTRFTWLGSERNCFVLFAPTIRRRSCTARKNYEDTGWLWDQGWHSLLWNRHRSQCHQGNICSSIRVLWSSLSQTCAFCYVYYPVYI